MSPEKLKKENIYHYYFENPGPLKSITELSEQDAVRIIKTIDETTAIHHSRLTWFPGYVPHRRSVEKLMRSQFIRRGGKPRRKTPFYFILGKETDYSASHIDCKILCIDPKTLDPDILSFTFCDSMIAFPFGPFFQKEGYNFTYQEKDFHGQVYHFKELGAVLDQYGHPDDKKNHDYDFPGFIEIQVWDDLNLDYVI